MIKPTLHRLADYTTYYYYDWDNMVVAWNGQSVISFCIYTTRGGTRERDFDLIDATPEIKAIAAESVRNDLKAIVEKKHKEILEVQTSVVFVKGYKSRKNGIEVKVGDTGRVFWKGPNQYARGQYCYGIELLDGSKVFVGPEKLQRVVSIDEIEFEVSRSIEDGTVFVRVSKKT
jgi:hypothetical protein